MVKVNYNVSGSGSLVFQISVNDQAPVVNISSPEINYINVNSGDKVYAIMAYTSVNVCIDTTITTESCPGIYQNATVTIYPTSEVTITARQE